MTKNKETLLSIMEPFGIELEPVKGKKEVCLVRARYFGKLRTTVPASRENFTEADLKEFEDCFVKGDQKGFQKHLPKIRKDGIFKRAFNTHCDKLRLAQMEKDDPDGKKRAKAQKDHDDEVKASEEHQEKKKEQQKKSEEKKDQKDKMEKDAKKLSDKQSQEKLDSENEQIEKDKEAHDKK